MCIYMCHLNCSFVSVFQDGWTLLHFAVHSGNIELVDWLIEEYKFDVQQLTQVNYY